MSTDLFTVCVDRVDGMSVVVNVTDTYHATSPPETETFFLAAFHEAAQASRGALAKAISEDEILDEGFLLRERRTYIDRVEVVAARPPAAATYRVVFTDPRWVDKLEAGATWKTASYDVGEPTLRAALDAVGGGVAEPVAPTTAHAAGVDHRRCLIKRPQQRATGPRVDVT
jgi:hypothetical protein